MEAQETSVDNPLAGGAGSGYLAVYFDAALVLPDDLSPEVITGDEIGRLCESLSIVIYSSSIPRRLGGDASSEELAIDKKRGRRTAHALSQSLRSWAGKIPKLDATDEVRQAGAQLDWARFREEHAAHLNARLRLVATWALMTSNDGFGKTAVVKLRNEINWVSYALRD